VAVVRDTVALVSIRSETIAQRVHDSAYASRLREEYAQRQHEYLRALVRADSLIALLWDGIGMLADENQSVAERSERLLAEASGLQERLSAAVAAAPPYSEAVISSGEPEGQVASWRARSQRLLAQPRTLYTVGADGADGEVEVTRCHTHGSEMYLAAAVEAGGEMAESAAAVAATLNGAPALYRYADRSGRVFVFRLPQLTGTVQLELTVAGRSYTIKTSIKNLL
jgi:hypothetical protein